MTVTTAMIKDLRAATGAGVLDCKKALESASGDMDRAREILLEKGLAKAAKKAGREARQGLVEAYVHLGRVAALVELNCETDFVARTPAFRELAHDLAMQVVAASPQYVTPDEIPSEVLDGEKRDYRAQMAGQKKPEHVLEKIIEGKLGKFYQEVCLLHQAFIKDQDRTVQDLITERIATLGENIVLRRFVRMELGGAEPKVG